MADAKLHAAKKALEFVEDGMTVGLGSGSTAALFIQLLGEKAKRGRLRLTCVASSLASEAIGRSAGLNVVDLDELDEPDRLNLAVDGADAVDPKFRLIKGGGACHAREKVLAYAADRFVCIVDESKLKKTLAGYPVPVEVLPFTRAAITRKLAREWRADVTLRNAKDTLGPLVTDNGNYVLDAVFGKSEIAEPLKLELALDCVPGIVANGVFAAATPLVVVGTANGAKVLA